MPRPVPTSIGHFTHIEHLSSIAAVGLLADAVAVSANVLMREAGEPGIKAQRRRRPVPIGAGGVVADYVPFYYASRSPMLYMISKGGVPTFTGDPHDLVYLITTIEELTSHGITPVCTDRNAVKQYARFTSDLNDLDELIDWPLMSAAMWTDTEEYPDRKERRMAECLAYRHVPWAAIRRLAVFDSARKGRVEAMLTRVAHRPPISVSPQSYF